MVALGMRRLVGRFSFVNHFARQLTFMLCLVVSQGVFASLPESIKRGQLDYWLGQGKPFSVLSHVAPDTYNEHMLHVASAEAALGLKASFTEEQLSTFVNAITDKRSREAARLRLAELFFRSGNCQDAFKFLKGKAKTLSESNKTKRAYFRGQCFIEFGKHNFAAQALSGALDGEMAANAYYNLAADYASISRNPKRALVALRVARDLNPGVSLSARELTNRINLSAGALYLDHDSPQLASQFFDQIDLDSSYATQALYLAGLARQEKQDYRAAIQAWNANQQRLIVAPGVAESFLALPAAQAISGYQTQALESYMRASAIFEQEIGRLDQLIAAIKRYGAVEVFLSESDKQDLAWFLDQGDSDNSYRAAYTRYIAQEKQTFALLKEYEQFEALARDLSNRSKQLLSFASTLITQQQFIKSEASKQARTAHLAKIEQLDQRVDQLAAKVEGPSLDALKEKVKNTVSALKQRALSIDSASARRLKTLGQQQGDIDATHTDLAKIIARIVAFQKKLAAELSEHSLQRLVSFKQELAHYYEQSELGLIQILEAQARLRTKRTNLLDGRYQ